MPLILSFAEKTAANLLIGNKPPLTGKYKLGLGLLALSIVFLCIVTVFAFISGYGWLLLYHTQPEAALITTVSGLFVALILMAIGCLFLKKKPSACRHSENNLEEVIELIHTILGEEIMQPVKDNPKTSMLLSAMAGYISESRLR